LLGVPTVSTGDRGTKKVPNIGDHALFSIMTTEPNGIVEPIHGKAMPVMLMTPDDVNSAGTADLLQATHQGPALREQLHRPSAKCKQPRGCAC
jgi:putative SOS response-associated peptidase YedK